MALYQTGTGLSALVGIGTTNPTSNLQVAGNVLSGNVIATVAHYGPIAGANTIAASSLTLTSALATNYGGTGLTSFTSGGLLYASSTSALASSSTYTAGQVLYGGGAGAAPGSSSSLFWDSGNSRLGIGTASPQQVFHVWTNSISGNPTPSGTGGDSNALVRFQFNTIGLDFGCLINGNTWIQNRQPTTSLGTAFPLLINPLGGNVGIGTTNPGSLLNIYNSQNSSVELRIQNPNTGTAALSQISFLTNDATGSGGRGGLAVFNSTYTASGLYRTSGTYLYNNGSGGITISSEAAYPIYFATSSAERMRIDSSGNVGIGTASPGWSLDVFSTGSRVANFVSSANGSGNIRFQCTDATTPGTGFIGINAFNNSVFGLGSLSAIPVTLYQGGTEYMRVHTNGNVGIGTTSPGAKLSVAGDIYMGIDPATYQTFKVTCGNNYGYYQGVYNGGSTNPDGLANSDIFIGVNYNQQTGVRDGAALGIAQVQLVAGNGTDGKINFRTSPSGSGTLTSVPTRMTVTSTGVGIGMTTPNYPLCVYGSNTSFQFSVQSYSTTLDFQGGSRLGTSIPGWTTIDPNGSGNTGVAIWDALAVGGWAAIGTSYAQSSTVGPTNGLIVQGNVGIGITNPTKPLVVQRPGSGGANPAIMVANNGSGSGLRFQTYDLTAQADAYMGLGTDMSGNPFEHSIVFPDPTTPGYVGNSRLTFGKYNGTTYTTLMTLLNGGSIYMYGPVYNYNTGAGNGYYTFGTSLDYRAMVTMNHATSTNTWAANQDVGDGDRTLSIQTTDTGTASGQLVVMTMQLSTYGNRCGLDFKMARDGYNSSNPLLSITQFTGTYRDLWYLSSSKSYFPIQNVGIGRTDPVYKLDVNGGYIRQNQRDYGFLITMDGATWDNSRWWMDGGSTYLDFGGMENGFKIRGNNDNSNPFGSQSYTEHIKIMPRTGTGNPYTGGVVMSMGGFSFDRTWDNYPSISVFNVAGSGSTNQGEFRIHGAAMTYSSYPDTGGADFSVVTRCDGGYVSGSDKRSKINISSITDALEIIMKIDGKRFQKINSLGEVQEHLSQNSYKFGFIAQDLQESQIDELYTHYEKEDDGTDNYNNTYSVDYASFVAVLTNAIKQQQAVITDLQTRLTALEKIVST